MYPPTMTASDFARVPQRFRQDALQCAYTDLDDLSPRAVVRQHVQVGGDEVLGRAPGVGQRRECFKEDLRQ